MKKENENKPIDEKRLERFTWEKGDGQFFASKEEAEEQARKEGRTIVWYDV